MWPIRASWCSGARNSIKPSGTRSKSSIPTAWPSTTASQLYARAIDAAGKLAPAPGPETLASLHAKYGAVLMVLAEYEAAVAEYQRALELIRRVGGRRGGGGNLRAPWEIISVFFTP